VYSYRAPLRDIRFVVHEVLDFERRYQAFGREELNKDLLEGILEEGARFAETAPLIRAHGEHSLAFSDAKAPLKELPPGEYRLVVEAAREVGGRELLRIPFQWPPKAAQSLSAKGDHELGALALELKP